MNKKHLYSIFILLMILFLLPVSAHCEEVNLLENGSFELLDAKGMPVGWYTDAWFDQPGYTEYGVTQGAKEGQNSIFVENIGSNDARFAQMVSVEPNSLYRLSGFVRTENVVDSGLGANLSVDGVYVFTDGLYGTASDWQEMTLYGKTGPDQRSLIVFARLGGYSGESEGKAYFDNLSLVKVSGIPQGALLTPWYKTDTQAEPISGETGEGSPAWPFLLLLGAGYVMLAAFLLPTLQKETQKTALQKDHLDQENTNMVLYSLLFAAFLGRVALAVLVPGYSVDIGCFTAWSDRMAAVGPVGFYAEGYFCDYPPGYLYVLWLNGIITSLMPTISQGALLLNLKFVPILTDMVTAWLIYVIGRKKVPEKSAAALALLYALNPTVIINGAAWGQVDSVLALGMVLVAILAMDRKWSVALPVFTACALIKPQALMLGPLGLVALVWDLKETWKDGGWKKPAWGICWSVLVAAVLVIPFTIGRNPDWIVSLYTGTLSSYPYATINTANLYYLLQANWVGIDIQMGRAIPLLFSFLFAALAIVKTIRFRNKAGSYLEKYGIAFLSIIACAAFLFLGAKGADYGLFGTVMMALVFLWVLILYLQGKRLHNLPLAGALLFMGLYVLGVKMHERYLFPALALFGIAYLQKRDRSILILLIGFSVTAFVNTGIVLDNAIRLGSSMGHLNLDTQGLNVLLSLCNLLLTGYGVYSGERLFSVSAPEKVINLHPLGREAQGHALAGDDVLLKPRDAQLRLQKKDWIIMIAVTAAYAVLTFWNLGSTKAPQTAWVSTKPDEQVILDLGETKDFELLYYGGINYQDFSVAVSADGEAWSEEYLAQMQQGNCFQWQYLVHTNALENSVSYSSTPRLLSGRYVRVTAQVIGLTLHEVILRTPEHEVLPVSLAANIGNNPNSTLNKPAVNLVDEQDTLEGEPGWFTGTYFDEIYHARTAYEHAYGISPYENSHPPLGKVFMSWAVLLFGMTPFGWRFAGAFTGVLMLPVMYLMGKQLTKRTDLATAAMLLMTFDLMHFTQTRIATIDSFPVLFIMLSYLCMFRFILMDYWGTRFTRTLIPLALSGLFMGLGIASKWVGIYAGVGLAILFFWSCWRHLLEGRRAKKLLEQPKSTPDSRRDAITLAANKSVSRFWITCLWCLLFFVAVPAVIYYLSYIPFFAPSGGVTLERIIAAQKHMFSYHSTPGLGADHPYQSPWWEWPLILKPMWFAMGTYVPEGMGSTIFCMGNPAVWWAGLAALAAVFVAFVKRHAWKDPKGRWLHLHPKTPDLVPALLLLGFASQYMPWVLVPRSTYIYHYFASVPFIILCTVVVFEWLFKRTEKNAKTALWGFVALAAVLFVGFYPYASGIIVSTKWLDFMKWFPRIYY